MSELPLTLKCPRGEEWPAMSFKSCVHIKEKVQSHDTITFECPAGHTFSLKKAVEKGMFNQEQALKIIAGAQRARDDLYPKRKRKQSV